MKITVNGDTVELPASCSITQLLEHLDMTGGRVAVELNQQIIPRSQHAGQPLSDGDSVEIVHAIGGG
jgi:sulfur carrier protein